MRIKKAVIAAGGWGLRFLPYSKSLPKEMLPIMGKPILQLIVEDLAEAGVEEIIIVVNENDQKIIKAHFQPNKALAQHLITQNYLKELKALEALNALQLTYLAQKSPAGSASPLIDSLHLLDNQPFFYCLGDDCFQGSSPASRQLLRVFRQTQQPVLALHRPRRNLLSRYGVVQIKYSAKNSFLSIQKIVEKPCLNEAPSDLAVAGHFLLTAEILPLVSRLSQSQNGELSFTDALNMLVGLSGLEVDGVYCDVGTPETYLESMIKIALDNPRHREDLKKFLKQTLAADF